MNCLYCGNKLPEQAAFCPVCGSPVVSEEPGSADPETARRRHKAHKRHITIVAATIAGTSAVVATLTTICLLHARHAGSAATQALKAAAKTKL